MPSGRFPNITCREFVIYNGIEPSGDRGIKYPSQKYGLDDRVISGTYKFAARRELIDPVISTVCDDAIPKLVLSRKM